MMWNIALLYILSFTLSNAINHVLYVVFVLVHCYARYHGEYQNEGVEYTRTYEKMSYDDYKNGQFIY